MNQNQKKLKQCILFYFGYKTMYSVGKRPLPTAVRYEGWQEEIPGALHVKQMGYPLNMYL
jgi:hypothetical protein